MPVINTHNEYWTVYEKTLFVDVHFYFVSGALIAIAVQTLQKGLNDPGLDDIVNNYAQLVKNLNDARNNIEHIDERIDRGISDLGNVSNGRYHFNGQFYDLYFDEMRQLRDDLCDYLLRKAQANLKPNH